MARGCLRKSAPICGLAIAIFVLSYFPEGAIEFGAACRVAGADKLAHAVAYGVLAWLLLRALSGRRPLRSALVAVLVVMAMGRDHRVDATLGGQDLRLG